jgi:microcystin-dependent protein
MGTHRHNVGSNDSTAQAGSDAGNQEFVRDSGAGNGPATYTNYESAGTPAGSISVASAGSSGTNANYQPYITVYMWKRTA